MSDYVVDFSKDIESERVDSISFGPLSKKLEDRSKDISTLLSVEDIKDIPFPKNSSEEVLEELNTIRLVQQTSPEWHQGDYKNKIDKNFLSIYTDYLDEFKLDYNIEYIKNVLEDINPFILKIKKKYNRPRPAQLSKYHEVNILTDETSTDKSPAYPSGHSFQAKVIETILIKEHPDHKNIFTSITDRVSLARILRGLHFPSDIRFSYFIVNNYLVNKI